MRCHYKLCWVLAWIPASSVQAGPPVHTAQLAGRIIEADGGKPVSGAKIAIAHLSSAYIYFTNAEELTPIAEQIGNEGGPALISPTVRVGQSDGEGYFRFDQLERGDFGIVIGHKEKGVAVLTAGTSPTEKLTSITLNKPTRILGRLANLKLDPTKNYVNLECVCPLPWLSLGVRLKVDSQGRFDSGPLPALGRWTLVGWEWELNNAYTGAVFKIPVEMKPNQDNSLDVDLAAGKSLRGKIVGPKGEPISYASVIARSQINNGQERGAITAVDGSFLIEGLADGGHQLNVDRWRLRKTVGCGPGARDIHLERKIEIDARPLSPLRLVINEFIASVETGEAAPDFTARTMAGQEIHLSSFRGKLVLLDFWATWCGMCQAALPTLARVQQDFRKDGLVVIGVSVDTDLKKAQSFVARHSISWPQTALGSIDVNPIARTYNVNSTPTILLIGRDGKILARDIAADDLKKTIAQALAESAAGSSKSLNAAP